jgi:uncharacterized membrane protein (DUF4010 family)
LSLILGIALGLKNEVDKSTQRDSKLMGGFRTYGIVSIVGIFSAILWQSDMQSISIVISVLVIGLIISYYSSGVFSGKAFGITSELSLFSAYMVGFFIVSGIVDIKYILVLTVVIIFLATSEHKFHAVRGKISAKEALEFSIFAIVALVIFPILPNKAFTISELGLGEIAQTFSMAPKYQYFIENVALFNPFKIWMIVVLVSSIDLIGYVVSKFTKGSNSLILSSLIGGFVSSTTTITSMAIESKESEVKDIEPFIAASLLANAASFIEILILMSTLSLVLTKRVFFSTAVLLLGFGVSGVYLWIRDRDLIKSINWDKVMKQKEEQGIISLMPAIKFATIVSSIQVGTKIFLYFLGDSAFVVSSSIATLGGLDAVVLNLAELVKGEGTKQAISLQTAFFTYMGSNFVNLLGKVGYGFIFGQKKFAFKLGIWTVLVFVVAFVLGI